MIRRMLASRVSLDIEGNIITHMLANKVSLDIESNIPTHKKKRSAS